MSVVDRLSPSKINTFRECPQHFAFRYVQGLEEPANAMMLRGTLVHEVCERLFDVAAEQRTLATAGELLHRLWERMVDGDPALRNLFVDAEAAAAWIQSAERLVATWLRLETPAALNAVGTEVFVETESDDGVLAGIIDRLDRLPDGTWAVTDYKTGSAPGPGWERGAFFQLRFYALVISRSLGLSVSRLRLVYLAGDGEVLELSFDADAASCVGRQVHGLATVMRRALESGEWRTNAGRHCDWCAFKTQCPAWSAGDEIVTNNHSRVPAAHAH